MNADHAPQAAWFKVGTSLSLLTEEAYLQGAPSGSAGSFSAAISSLAPNTKYYYRAYMTVWTESGYVDIESENYGKFTTTASEQLVQADWLELPALSTGSADYTGVFYGTGGNPDEARNYSYSYSYTYYASMWVAYPLKGSHKTGSASTSTWAYNPNIASTKQVKVRSGDGSYPSMYGASDYSRGHQCHNADRKSDELMNEQTYYVTNQTPQLDNKFNGSIWSKLENAERSLVSNANDVVYVITGPAYRTVGGNETINYLEGASGKNANPARLPVPNYYWKAFLKVKMSGGQVQRASAIGFWFEHREYDSTRETYPDFAVSVDEIERLTGFDLFTNLPDGVEATAESNTSWTAFQSF